MAKLWRVKFNVPVDMPDDVLREVIDFSAVSTDDQLNKISSESRSIRTRYENQTGTSFVAATIPTKRENSATYTSERAVLIYKA